MPGQVVWPLSLCAGAALATVGALWAGTILDRGRTRGRLALILGVGLSTAAVISTAYLAMRVLDGSLIVSTCVTLLLGVAVIALNVSVATWRFRDTGRNLRRDALLTLALLVLVPVAVSAIIVATCTLGNCSG